MSALDHGFVVSDSMGRKIVYGTSPDARVSSSDGRTVREWRVKRQIDPHGNFVTFNYSSMPPPEEKEGSVQRIGSEIPQLITLEASYLTSIDHTSNKMTGHRGNRRVTFDYSPRNDPVVQTLDGGIVIYSHILSTIRCVLVKNEREFTVRFYRLTYCIFSFTASSCLSSIAEVPDMNEDSSRLISTTFGYSEMGVLPGDLFRPSPKTVSSLHGTAGNISLLPFNVSGRALADLVSMRDNRRTSELCLKTYLAFRNQEQVGAATAIDWKPSEGNAAESLLHIIHFDEGRPFPSILGADLNGDGRVDLVVPFKGSDGFLNLSISQSTGTGFQNHRVKPMDYSWTDESKFLTVDLTGRGEVNIIQVFSNLQKLAFRNFSSIDSDGEIILYDATVTTTEYDY